MSDERPQDYLGKGFDSTPRRPFGYAWNMERRAIEEHMISRGWSRDDMRFYFRVSAIQERIHKYAPTFRERQATARARRESWAYVPDNEAFTAEELAHIAAHFAGANDPLAQSILAKASR